LAKLSYFSTGIDPNQALKTAQSGANCFQKIFSCFGGDAPEVPSTE